MTSLTALYTSIGFNITIEINKNRLSEELD